MGKMRMLIKILTTERFLDIINCNRHVLMHFQRFNFFRLGLIQNSSVYEILL
uniref:Uncharacterized protein n=1 Tax=Rhizophora mucronata TaxID=61149 RepID=A0A2P2PHB8_RHIMU